AGRSRRRYPRRHRAGMEGGPAAVPLAQPEQSLRGVDAARPRDTHVRGGQAGAQERRMKKATLALACGETFEGFACGAAGEAQGEVVFNTSHTGYQEILTDPSYAGQLVTFTVAELGNYGVHHGDEQADAPQVAGFIARRVSREPSNWRADEALPAWLARHDVVVVDYGVKRGILRQLVDSGCRVRVVPSRTPAAEILARKPHGVVLSNGPGDPAAVVGGDRQAAELLGKVPVLGICLGHQIL